MNEMIFVGVVEDVNDPMEMGRLRVRIHGVHTANLRDLPTERLPWASTASPVTGSSMGGHGVSLNVREGAWVTGFFLDEMKQQPLVTGVINGTSYVADAAEDTGFRDPFKVDVSGVDLPESGTSCRFTVSAEYERRVEAYPDDRAVPVATHLDEDERVYWSLPTATENVFPSYPNNHVISTESGHAIEMDDTPGFERVALHHRSGSRVEWTQDGNRVEIVRGDGFRVVIGDDHVVIEGNSNLTVLGDARIHVKGDQIVEVDGNQITTVHGDRKTYIGGDDLTEVTGDTTLNIGEDRATHVHGEDTFEVSGSLTEEIGGSQSTNVSERASITASRIDLN